MSVTELSLPRFEAAHCEVCGSSDLHVDEVQTGGRLLLAECGRCDHRWMGRVGGPRFPRSGYPMAAASPAKAEVATAA
jgi:hypothetical protein